MGSRSTEMEAHGPHAPRGQGRAGQARARGAGRARSRFLQERKLKAWTPRPPPPPMRRRCSWPAWPTNCRTETRTPSSPPSLGPLHSSLVVADPKGFFSPTPAQGAAVQLGVAALLLRLRGHLLPQEARQGRGRLRPSLRPQVPPPHHRHGRALRRPRWHRLRRRRSLIGARANCSCEPNR
jgi:hypothetical protein